MYEQKICISLGDMPFFTDKKVMKFPSGRFLMPWGTIAVPCRIRIPFGCFGKNQGVDVGRSWYRFVHARNQGMYDKKRIYRKHAKKEGKKVG